MSRFHEALAWIPGIALFAASPAFAECATKPPPDGLAKRCHSMSFITPSDSMSDDLRKTTFRMALIEWMKSCVIEERAPGLVYENPSVDEVWALIGSPELRFRKFVIEPDYTPSTYSEGDETCYGVESVAFRLKGRRTTVDADQEIEVTPAERSPERIKEAAAAAQTALDGRQVGKFGRVLGVLKDYYGEDFDDTYFNVRPIAHNVMSMSTPPACFTDFEGGRYVCRPGSEVLATCERHLLTELVTAYAERGDSPASFADALEEMAGRIQDGVDYLYQVNHVQPDNPAVCSAVKDVLIPKVEELSRGGMKTVYGAGGY